MSQQQHPAASPLPRSNQGKDADPLRAFLSRRRKHRGYYWVADDRQALLDAIEKDAQSKGVKRRGVVWVHAGNPPPSWRVIEPRNPENCDHASAARLAREKGYQAIQQVCRRCSWYSSWAYHAVRCAGDCEAEGGCHRVAPFPGCSYFKQFQQPTGLLAIPDWALVSDAAKHGTVVVLDCAPPSERLRYFWFEDLQDHNFSPEHGQVSEVLVMAALGTKTLGLLEGGPLYTILKQSVPVPDIVAVPEWEPQTSIKSLDASDSIEPWVTSLPPNFSLMIEALRDDAKSYLGGFLPGRVRLAHFGNKEHFGGWAVGVGEARPLDKLAWLKKKAVIVVMASLSSWAADLEQLGLTPWTPPVSTLDKLVAAAIQLMKEGTPVTLNALAQAAGVSAGSAHNYKGEVAAALHGEWIPGPKSSIVLQPNSEQ